MEPARTKADEAHAKMHFLDKALFKDRNFVLSAIMYFAFGFVLLPTIALTSPMLDELLNYPADTTGYMAIPRSIALVGGSADLSGPRRSGADRQSAALGRWNGPRHLRQLADARLFTPDGLAFVVVAGMVQGAGLGILLPTLTKVAFSTLDPIFRPEGTVLFNLSRLYGSSIGVAVVLTFFTTIPRPCTSPSPRTSRPSAPRLMSRVRLPNRGLPGSTT